MHTPPRNAMECGKIYVAAVTSHPISVPLHYETTICTPSSPHAFFRPDQARGLFPRQGPPAILGRTLQGNLVPAAYRGGVVRRANDIGEIHERVLHPKCPVTNRLDPPGIEARGELGMPLQVGKQRAFLVDLST